MVRTVCYSLAALLVVSALAGGAVPEPFRRAIVVVGLHNPEQRRSITIGTAFYVGRRLFYTNAHVVLDRQRIQREDGPGYNQWMLVGANEFGSPVATLGTADVQCVDTRYKPTPWGEPEPYDVALLRFTGPEERLSAPLVISAVPIRPGERARVIGYPGGAVLIEAWGTVTDVNAERIIVTRDSGAAALPGSSGSPLLNARGEVVGIHQGSNVVRLLMQAVPIHTALAGCPI
ncbi:MAG: serine protease [Armatimonadota bacterium]|nr:serine protease [Armatimonadota bacterium]